MAIPDAKVIDIGSQPTSDWQRNWHKKLFWIVLIAFLLRVAAIGITHTYRPRTSEAHFGFGWEMGRIARSIAAGEGFASPFTHIGTGPTAWEPPIYPYFMAGVFKVFGTYTRLSAFVLLTVNSLFSALTCIPVFLLARRIFGLRVARWSAWAWALFPYAMYWCVKWLWETSITAFVLACLILLTMDLEDADGYTKWLGWGLLWGFAALLNPAVLSFLPCAGLWLAWRRSQKRKEWFLPSLAAALFFVLTISPWIARNYAVFGQFVFIRSNFGAEFRMGNGPNAVGLWMAYLHPRRMYFSSQNIVRWANWLTFTAEKQKRWRGSISIRGSSREPASRDSSTTGLTCLGRHGPCSPRTLPTLLRQFLQSGESCAPFVRRNGRPGCWRGYSSASHLSTTSYSRIRVTVRRSSRKSRS